MDALSQLDVIVPKLQGLVTDTRSEQLDLPTPCAAWQVRDLLGHLLGGGTAFAAAVRGEPAPDEVAPVADAIFPAAVSAALADLDDAFRGPGALERIVATPFGEMPGDVFARLLAFDALIHTWDLATATGRTVDVPDDVVSEVDGFIRVALQPEMRGPGTFGPEVEPEAGATPLERLVAFAGRKA